MRLRWLFCLVGLLVLKPSCLFFNNKTESELSTSTVVVQVGAVENAFVTTIPDELLAEVNNVIEFALLTGSAREVSKRDFYHCHILVERQLYNDLSNEHLQRIDNIMDSYIGLLCHTQELSAYDISKRNIVVWRGSSPRIESPPYGERTLSVSDLDRDSVGAAGISFAVADNGYKFKLRMVLGID